MIESFLEENRSVLSNNVENHLDIELETKNRLLPDESLVDEFSIYGQYVKERDECCTYRVILDVNPVCSNVLFNSISEIVVNEGSDSAVCLNFTDLEKDQYAPNAINTYNPITYKHAIRDTEYSHPENGKFVYHCGVDIFNNHMLRKKIFVHINKANYKEGSSAYTLYNTIGDYLRDNNGDIIRENIGIKYTDGSGATQDMHIYGTDSLDNLKNAFYAKCKESEGWWGFTNPGTIDIPNSDNPDITINEMLANNKPCEFIDFYPDRSLFSFIPKYNKYRRRLENNWDYCITYPYGKDFDLINTICGGKNGEILAKIKTVTNSSGVKLLQCSSLFKHSFTSGSYVNFYYYMFLCDDDHPEFVNPPDFDNPEYVLHPTNENEMPEYTNDNLEFQLYQKVVRVYSTGDLNGKNKDRIFSVKYDDIKSIYKYFASFGCYYKKVTNGCEASYYARKFKKLKNVNGEPLINDANKAAFAKNIYGDDITQIVFTDNVDLCGIMDENGRDVSEIYFTAIKRNAGNTEWYDDKVLTGETVEFSHCFGELTSGIDFSGVDINEEPFDYNIHYLHNMDSGVCENDIQASNTFSAWGETILRGMPKFIESGITIDNDEFYGDIVEFDNYEYQTNVIGNIFHRFNTAQREKFDLKFRDMYQDIVSYDDYDSVNLGRPFGVRTYYCNDTISGLHDVDITSATCDYLMYANIHPEGYYYNPHSKIKLKDYGEVNHSLADYINYSEYKLTGQNVIYIYKRVNGVDTLIGKKYIYDYYEPDTGDEGGDSNGGAKATAPPTSGDTYSVHFVEGVEGCVLKVKVPADYGFVSGDYVAMYDKLTQDVYWGVIKSFKDMYLTIYFNDDCFDGMDILNHVEYFGPDNAERRFFMFWTKDSVPVYAKLCLSTKEFSWRPILKTSELDNNNDLTKLPFSNGCIYVQKNINFFLRRQDPYGDYGLSYPLFKETQQFVSNPMTRYIIYGSDKVDLSINDFVFDNDLNTCY